MTRESSWRIEGDNDGGIGSEEVSGKDNGGKEDKETSGVVIVGNVRDVCKDVGWIGKGGDQEDGKSSDLVDIIAG